MPKNEKSIGLLHSQIKEDELCHMTPAEKKAYNAEYYRQHKNYWQDYYNVGATTGGRPKGHEKNVVQGGTGVKRRGNGLGSGKVGAGGYSNGRETIITENTLVEQSPEQWSQQHTQIQAGVNQAKKKLKKAASQAASDWQSGVRTVSQISSEVLDKGKKLVSGLFSKFR